MWSNQRPAAVKTGIIVLLFVVCAFQAADAYEMHAATIRVSMLPSVVVSPAVLDVPLDPDSPDDFPASFRVALTDQLRDSGRYSGLTYRIFVTVEAPAAIGSAEQTPTVICVRNAEEHEEEADADTMATLSVSADESDLWQIGLRPKDSRLDPLDGQPEPEPPWATSELLSSDSTSGSPEPATETTAQAPVVSEPAVVSARATYRLLVRVEIIGYTGPEVTQ